jgi:hypothetical protein
MSKLHCRLWVAISVSTLTISVSHPAMAKPLASFATSSQIVVKAPTSTRIAPPPIDAILAQLKSNSSLPSKPSHSVQHQVLNRKSPTALKQTKLIKNADRSGSGIARFIDSGRDPNFSAVNQLIK